MYDNFKECSTSLDDKKIIQVSSGGPNIHLTFLNIMRKKKKENNLIELLEMGTCNLHIGQESFKYGLNATKWDLDNILSTMWKMFDLLPEELTLNSRPVETIHCSSVLTDGLKKGRVAQSYSDMT